MTIGEGASPNVAAAPVSAPPAVASFNLAARLLHWAMAFGLLSMVFIGVGIMTSLTWRPALIDLHQPLGLMLLLLACLRLTNRLASGAPSLPPSVPRLQQIVAGLLHWALYALMLAIPLVGWAMRSAGGWPIRIGGGWQAPPILPTDPTLYAILRDAHGVLAWTLFALVVGHLSAALLHAWVLRDGVFSSMTWRGGRDRAERL